MKIAYVADNYLDPRRPNSWSGLPFFMRRSLEQAGADVEVCVVTDPNSAVTLLRYAYWRFIRGRRYLRGCESRVLRRNAAEIERRLKLMRADAVFCPSSWPVAYLRSSTPTIFWTDAGFAGMVNFYESFSNLAASNAEDGHAAEYAALRNCARAIYSSEWAAATARDSYSADASKVRVVPFGANILDRPSVGDVVAFAGRREMNQCNLLLIGVDWRRKGAEIAVEAARCLNERAFPARLTVVGCKPPRNTSLPPYVEVIPFVNKATEAGRRQFAEICRRSHFLIMPTRADCTPVAIAEANCFGLPCLSTDIGGISSIVSNSVNGRLFDLKARGVAYADYVLGLMRDPVRYRAMALASAEFANRHFTWEVSGARVIAIINEVLSIRSHSIKGASLAVGTGT